MNTIDYDYAIVQAHERLNRLLPVITASDAALVEIAELYKHINALVESKKALSNWTITDYGVLVENSKEGRERVGVYPYPKNKFDTISNYKKMIVRSKFNRAWKIVKFRIAQGMV